MELTINNYTQQENDERMERDEEDGMMEDIFDNAMASIDGGLSVKRQPPPPKLRINVDWDAFKMTFAQLKDNG